MFGLKKYRLLPGEVVTLHGRAHVVHRIMALRDIPAQDVKSGDMGGYVSSKKTLSHRGDAWITPNAAVISNPEIEYDYVVIGDVLIADQAVLVDTRVRFSSRLIIGGNAYIQQSRILSEASEPQQSSIIGDIEIVGSTIIGQIKIRDKAYIHDSNISGSEGLPVITAGASILGSSIEGPCRIAGHTHIEFSKVGPNANISDTASVIDSRVGGLGQIHIKDNAAVNKANIDTDSGSKVSISDHVIFEGDESHKAKIEANVCDEITLSGKAHIKTTAISGMFEAKDNASITGAKITGTNLVAGDAVVKSGAVLRDKNRITGDAVVPGPLVISGFTASTGTLSANVERSAGQSLSTGVKKTQPTRDDDFAFPSIPSIPAIPGIPALHMPAMPQMPKMPKFPNFSEFHNFASVRLAPASSGPAKIQPKPSKPKEESYDPYLHAIEETLAEYDSYEQDIIKLLKYPAMADSSIPEVRELKLAVRKVRRELKNPSYNSDVLKELATELDSAFIVAETKVHTLTHSHLDEKSKSALKSAEQMLSLACNESATDNEKRTSFKAGMKKLEGILPVSETAIQLFKEKAGLLEIEA